MNTLPATLNEKNLNSEIETIPSKYLPDAVFFALNEKNLNSEIETSRDLSERTSMRAASKRKESQFWDWNSVQFTADLTANPALNEKNLNSEIETSLAESIHARIGEL